MINRENLEKLAKYVDSLPDDYKQFDMEKYCDDPDGWEIDPDYSKAALKANCKTCACFLGHGPLAGIKPNSEAEDWEDYCISAFGIYDGSEDWSCFFGDHWPNDTKAAAKRVFDYLATGVLPTL